MYRVLDAVVLNRDLPDHGLRRGDLGAVVEVYEPDGVEVESGTASGRTAAQEGCRDGEKVAVGGHRRIWYSLPSRIFAASVDEEIT